MIDSIPKKLPEWMPIWGNLSKTFFHKHNWKRSYFDGLEGPIDEQTELLSEGIEIVNHLYECDKCGGICVLDFKRSSSNTEQKLKDIL